MQTSFTVALIASSVSAFNWIPDPINAPLDSRRCEVTDSCWIDGCDSDAIKTRTAVTEETYLECI